MSTITITQTLEVNDFKNLLYNAWHYSHYWLDLNCDPAVNWYNAKFPETCDLPCIEDKLWAYLEAGHKVQCYDQEDGQKFWLTWAMILEGIRVFVQDFSNHYEDFLTENDDAVTADVWLQCVCFGDVVYG